MSETKPDRAPIVYNIEARSFSIGDDTFSTEGLTNETIELLAMRGLASMIRGARDRIAMMASVREGVVFGRAGKEPKPRKSKSRTLAAIELAVATRLWQECTDKKPGTRTADGVASMIGRASAEVATWTDDRKKGFAKTPAYFLAMAELAKAEAETA